MDGRCSGRAVCDRLLTLLNEEVVEYIRLILRCGSLVWGVIEVGDGGCGFLLKALHDVVETSIASGVCRCRLDKD